MRKATVSVAFALLTVFSMAVLIGAFRRATTGCYARRRRFADHGHRRRTMENQSR